MQTDLRAKRSPFPFLAGPYGHPFHPIAVTIPIGAWVASLVFDIGAHVSSANADALALGARWLIAVGIVGAAIAACIGLLDLLTIPHGTAAYATALAHASLNAVVTLGFVGDFLWRENDNSATAVGPLVLSVVCLLILGVSGALGGMLAYRYGIRVADDATQAPAFTPARGE
ncbi:MAG: DUF2231 domain-containing protein [Marmoricola sp.]